VTLSAFVELERQVLTVTFYLEVCLASSPPRHFAAKAFPGLSHQTAYNINLVLDRLGVIKIVRVGDPRPNGKASKFRYLLSQSENGAEEDDGGLEI
jgi:hypothetical protein